MEPQGFCMIKDEANFERAMGKKEDWTKGQIIMCMEINERSKSVLALKGNNMGMFEFEDLRAHFKCDKKGIFLFPPGLTLQEQMTYEYYVTRRNGGYQPLMMNMIIMASLHRREFCDSVLWQKGQNPEVVEFINRLKEKAKQRTDKNQKAS